MVLTLAKLGHSHTLPPCSHPTITTSNNPDEDFHGTSTETKGIMEHDGMNIKDLPVLPIEIFGYIIDMVGIRPVGALLTNEQKGLLQACALVCKSFLPLARTHIFKLLQFGLRHQQWEESLGRLVQLLETRPDIRMYIRHLLLDLRFYHGAMVKDPVLTRLREILFHLPAVEAIIVYYQSPLIARLTRDTDVGRFCEELIDEHASRRRLRFLCTKKVTRLTLTSAINCSALHTLRIDRGDLPMTALTEPLMSVRTLALRKMDVDLSFILYFPNLEELRLTRVGFLTPSQRNAPLTPPCNIKTLGIELCSMSGTHESGNTASFLQFLQFFRDTSKKHGRKALEHLTSLEVMIVHESAADILPLLLEDVVRLQSLSYEAFPIDEVTALEVIKYFNSIESLHSTYSPEILLVDVDSDLIPEVFPPLSHLGVTSDLQTRYRPKGFCAATAEIPLTHFTGLSPKLHVVETKTIDIMKPWASFMTSLSRSRSSFSKVDKLVLYLVVDVDSSCGKKIVAGTKAGNNIPEDFINEKGCILGTYLEDFNGTHFSLMKVFFAVND